MKTTKKTNGDVSLLQAKLVSESTGEAQRFPGERMELDGKPMWILDIPTVIRRKAHSTLLWELFQGRWEVVYR